MYSGCIPVRESGNHRIRSRYNTRGANTNVSSHMKVRTFFHLLSHIDIHGRAHGAVRDLKPTEREGSSGELLGMDGRHRLAADPPEGTKTVENSCV